MNPYKPGFGDRFWKVSSAPFYSAAEFQREFEYAALVNNLWRACYLLEEKGVDVRGHEDFAIRWAANGNHAEMIRLLARCGGDVDAKEGEALRRAAGHGHLEAASVLVSLGARVSLKEGEALRIAARQHDLKMLRLLLSAPDAPQNVIEELRQQATEGGQHDLARLLGEYRKKDPPAPPPPGR